MVSNNNSDAFREALMDETAPATEAMRDGQRLAREVQTQRTPDLMSANDAHLLRDIASGKRTPHARQTADDFTRGIRDERDRREREMRERDEADAEDESSGGDTTPAHGVKGEISNAAVLLGCIALAVFCVAVGAAFRWLRF